MKVSEKQRSRGVRTETSCQSRLVMQMHSWETGVQHQDLMREIHLDSKKMKFNKVNCYIKQYVLLSNK